MKKELNFYEKFEEMNIEEKLQVVKETTSQDVLLMLSNNEEWLIRVGVAENPNTPSYILNTLGMEDNFSMKQSVFENPNTSPYTLEDLDKELNYEYPCEDR